MTSRRTVLGKIREAGPMERGARPGGFAKRTRTSAGDKEDRT
jgi:hypothetical protein